MGHAQSKFNMEKEFGIRNSPSRRGKKAEIKKDTKVEKREPKPRVPITPKVKNSKRTKKVSKKPQRSIVEANKIVIVKPKAETPKPIERLRRSIWMP